MPPSQYRPPVQQQMMPQQGGPMRPQNGPYPPRPMMMGQQQPGMPQYGQHGGPQNPYMMQQYPGYGYVSGVLISLRASSLHISHSTPEGSSSIMPHNGSSKPSSTVKASRILACRREAINRVCLHHPSHLPLTHQHLCPATAASLRSQHLQADLTVTWHTQSHLLPHLVHPCLVHLVQDLHRSPLSPTLCLSSSNNRVHPQVSAYRAVPLLSPPESRRQSLSVVLMVLCSTLNPPPHRRQPLPLQRLQTVLTRLKTLPLRRLSSPVLSRRRARSR
jgi:hypothetical protein